MDKRTKNTLLSVAAEILVLPITVYATGHQIVTKFNESETGNKVKAYAKQAGTEIGAAAKKVAESETVQNAKAKFDGFTEKAENKFREFSDAAEANMNGTDAEAEDAQPCCCSEAVQEPEQPCCCSEAVQEPEQPCCTEAPQPATNCGCQAQSLESRAENRFQQVQGDLNRIQNGLDQ